MSDANESISISIPGNADYALVLRTALGGIGMVKNLSIDLMDDLMTAADECVDLLVNQHVVAQTIHMTCAQKGNCLETVFKADLTSIGRQAREVPVEVSRAILETLMPKVDILTDEVGVKAITICQPITLS